MDRFQLLTNVHQMAHQKATSSIGVFPLSSGSRCHLIIEMHSDRGLQAAAGVVLAFSMLWTIAILIPDKSASRPMGFRASDLSDGVIVHAEYPRIVKSKVKVSPYFYSKQVCIFQSLTSIQNIRASERFRSTKTSMQSRALAESSFTRTQPEATESQPTYTSNQRQQQNLHTKRLFPSYVWYLTALFLYKTRNFVKKRNKRELEYADESFFPKSGLESSLEYGYGLEPEDPDDFMSVNSSFISNYGSSSRWTPDMNNKFDLEGVEEYELADTI